MRTVSGFSEPLRIARGIRGELQDIGRLIAAIAMAPEQDVQNSRGERQEGDYDVDRTSRTIKLFL